MDEFDEIGEKGTGLYDPTVQPLPDGSLLAQRPVSTARGGRGPKRRVVWEFCAAQEFDEQMRQRVWQNEKGELNNEETTFASARRRPRVGGRVL